jgi:prepilin-type processing-associated H-X9-DG protein
MKHREMLSKRDVIVLIACIAFALAGMGAVGATGRSRAKEAVCLSNLKGWGMVWKSCTDDRDGRFPDRGEMALEWPFTAFPYYRNPKLMLCPAATKPFIEGGLYPFAAWKYEGWDYETVCAGSYCVNYWASDEYDARFWGTPHIVGAASVPLLVDGNWKDAEPIESDEPFSTREEMVRFGWTPNEHEMRRVCIDRHGAYVNACFLDFSVRRIGLKRLWRVPWHREWDMGAPLPVWPEWMQNFKDY